MNDMYKQTGSALGHPENIEDHALTASLAQYAITPKELEDGNIYAVKRGDNVELLETPGYTRDVDDARASRPRRINRGVTLRTVDSLLSYLGDHTDTDAGHYASSRINDGEPAGWLEVWADLPQRRIHAILDGGDGWRMHTATLELRHSREWNEWLRVDGKLFNQVEFAHFIEEHLSSIGAPDGAELLDVCQTLQAAKSVDFKSSNMLANGQQQFRYEETIDAKAGQKGDLKIPAELTLVVRPFEGSQPVAIQARFRYRINDGMLLLGVKLNEPERLLEDAFDGVVADVEAGVPVPVLFGSPN